ncbi:chemotaxis protein CheA [Herbaspirillum sp. ST 5-3]|uniref:chemotaxis protein CheA n=1 Tax=Oxalobacteraceae TaxID=75682 RepID=UPI001B3B903D|nr:chemotaxis protein CheA [Herbaspirillum sp. ST 5-3]
MNLDQALQTYLEESRGLLQEMENALLALEHDPGDADHIGALFRAAHTIKGSAGLFGLDAVVSFTHVMESLLDRLREDEIAATEELIGTLLACCDHLGELIDITVEAGERLSAEQAANGEALLGKLHKFLGGGDAPSAAAAPSVPAEREEAVESDGGSMLDLDNWHISVRFGPDVLRDGMDPSSFLRYLGTIGEIVSLQTRCDDMPGIDEMDPESCYLGFEIDFRDCPDKRTIEDVFEFVRDSIRLRILPPPSHLAKYMDQIGKLSGNVERLGEILMEAGILTDTELAEALEMQDRYAADRASTALGEPQRLGQILVEEGMVQKEVVKVALEKQKQLRETKSQESKFIRVNAEKLDQLINLVGELVIAGASASLLARRSGNASLYEATTVISRFVEEIREDALRLRMVEIGETFNRFQRVVRDVSKEIGKDIGLHIAGGDTELDKTVVEKIGDPLTHLVRNAMDHGIEPAAARVARGKPERGMVSLNAYHDSGSIVIEVADDGGGLSRERILAKAIERGLINGSEVLSDRDVFNLVFEPGFSTADKVTNLSGRGVGMDVVKRNIEALRGTVDIDSKPEQGTTVRIRLPLTLAIIDGFLVGVGKSSYVVPLDMVLECVEVAEADRQASSERNYINLRGEVLPYMRLREQFNVDGKPGRRENIVVVQYAGQKAGLAVDELMGEFQTVIKPLGKLFSHVRGVSGSTILGSGEVALILDVPALVQLAASREAVALNA